MLRSPIAGHTRASEPATGAERSGAADHGGCGSRLEWLDAGSGQRRRPRTSIVQIGAFEGVGRLSLASRLREFQAAILERTFEQMTPAGGIECLQDIKLTDAQRAELRRRVAAYRADPTSGVPWEPVLERTRAR